MNSSVNNRITNLSKDLQNALARLEEAAQLEPILIHKDATIQRFEFCFELCWKLMQAVVRFQGLEANSPRESIRAAAQIGLLDNPEVWLGYLEARNLVAHTYNEPTADEVYHIAKDFIVDGQELLRNLGNFA